MAAVRGLSHVLFGQRYRLELMVAIAASADGLVCLTDLAKELDVTASNLQNSLRALTSAGLVARMSSGDSRRRYYVRQDSLAWDFATQIAQRAGALALTAPD